MSANNYVLIKKQYDGYIAQEMDIEGNPGLVITFGHPLKETIRLASQYIEENEVEYGVQFGEI